MVESKMAICSNQQFRISVQTVWIHRLILRHPFLEREQNLRLATRPLRIQSCMHLKELKERGHQMRNSFSNFEVEDSIALRFKNILVLYRRMNPFNLFSKYYQN